MFGDVTFAQAPFAALGGATLAASLDESASVAAIVTAESNFGGSITEQATAISAVLNSNNTLTATQAETVVGAATPNFAASTLFAAQVEASTASDTNSAAATLFAAQAEAATASDTQSAIATLLAAITETATGADSQNRGLLISVALSEAVSASASQTITTSVNASIAEVVSAVASVSASKTVNVNVTGVQLLVSVGNVLIWVVIDDSQNPNWQNITNTQNPGWNNLPS